MGTYIIIYVQQVCSAACVSVDDAFFPTFKNIYVFFYQFTIVPTFVLQPDLI